VPEGKAVVARTSVDLVVSQGPSADRLPVPNVTRKTLSEAERLVLNAGFVVGNISYQVNLELLPNTVIDQYPRAGGFAPRGQAIELFVAQKRDTTISVED
jgi:beta-lactam-binding protein with PASTA domain